MFLSCSRDGNMSLQQTFWPISSMSTGRHSFKHNDAARLIRAVEAAGKKITGVTLKDGAVTVLVGGAPHSASGNDKINPWDDVLEDRFEHEAACLSIAAGIPITTASAACASARAPSRPISAARPGRKISCGSTLPRSTASPRRLGNIGAGRTIPGSFNALCVSYYRSPEFRDLRATTQTVRRNIIEAFRRQHGDKPLKGLKRAHIKEIIGAKADTPESANNLLKVLRLMLNYALDQEMIDSSPALGVKGYTSRGEGYHTWSEDEIAAFETHHPVGSTARLAFMLLLYTAQRVGDVVRMGWQHVKGDRIAVRQQKTDTPLLIKMHPELVRVLASVPKGNLTFLITNGGAPFDARVCRIGSASAVTRPGCALPAHGLRKSAATRLANAGASTDHIKAHTGHRTSKEVERYTRAADQARLDEQALELQLRAEREQNFVQPETRLDKKSGKRLRKQWPVLK